MLQLEQTNGKDGVILRHGDIVTIDENVLGPKDAGTGKIERIENAGNVDLVYLWHRDTDGRMRLKPFNAKHLSKL